MYHGVQGMQDFGPGRELPEDSSDMEHQLFWSTCRPKQVRLQYTYAADIVVHKPCLEGPITRYAIVVTTPLRTHLGIDLSPRPITARFMLPEGRPTSTLGQSWVGQRQG